MVPLPAQRAKESSRDEAVSLRDCRIAKDSFLLLSDILESAGELSEKVPYEQLVTTDFAKKAASH